MKKKISLLIVFSLVTFVLSAQFVTDKKSVWDYPVKPGMEEWKKFESNEEMVKACQIPEKVLSSLSTETLMDLCLQYPLLYDVFAFDNLNEGLKKLFNDFNGIRELYKRKDVSKELLKRYDLKMQNLSFLNGKASDVDKGLFIVSISALEVLLCQYDSKTVLIKENSKEIMRNLVSGYEKKSMYADYFKGFGFRTNFYSRTHVIVKMDTQNLEKLPNKERNAALFSGMTDVESVNIINELSYRLLK